MLASGNAGTAKRYAVGFLKAKMWFAAHVTVDYGLAKAGGGEISRKFGRHFVAVAAYRRSEPHFDCRWRGAERTQAVDGHTGNTVDSAAPTGVNGSNGTDVGSV